MAWLQRRPTLSPSPAPNRGTLHSFNSLLSASNTSGAVQGTGDTTASMADRTGSHRAYTPLHTSTQINNSESRKCYEEYRMG